MHSAPRAAGASAHRPRRQSPSSAPPKGDSEPRILYWYRTPPGVKVGRQPFDAATQKELEAQYPGIVFDWRRIAETPFPPPDAEYWRERRRAEKAAKQARLSARDEEASPDEAGAGDAEAAEAALADETPSEDEAEAVDVSADDSGEELDLLDGRDGSEAPSLVAEAIVDSASEGSDEAAAESSRRAHDSGNEGDGPALQAENAPAAARPQPRRRSRRRRRGRRGGSGSGQPPAGSGAAG
jgi:hypothetical protein